MLGLAGEGRVSEDENLILWVCVVAGLMAAATLSSSRLHDLFTRGNRGIGLHRAAVLATLAWTGYVIAFHGDESIRGIYVLFYLVLAYAAVKGFGQLLGPSALGLNVRRDVLVRGNRPIALFTSTFALATGLIFGSSLWGEADPLSDAEGGWWIPVGFFLLGWMILVTATRLFAWRSRRFHLQLRREHDMRTGRTAAMFVLSSTFVILQGVAGDFWGWTEGLLSMGTIALMLIGHELLAWRPGGDAGEVAYGDVMSLRELLEHVLFVGLAVGCWWLNRQIAAQYVLPATGG
jgi:hypothetical protein